MKIIRNILATLLIVSISNASEIKLLTEDWAPYQMKSDGVISGISINIVEELQKRVSNNSKIKFYPWNRGYNMTLKKSGYALFSTTRTPEREKLFKWVGPLVSLKLVFFKLASNNIEYKTLEDAKKAKAIAVTKNDATEQYLTKLGFKNLQIKTGGASQIDIKKLIKGKADLWPGGLYAGHYRIKQLGMEGKIVETKVPAYAEEPLSIAFSKSTPDEVILKWQKALDDMKADGTYDKILKKYK